MQHQVQIPSTIGIDFERVLHVIAKDLPVDQVENKYAVVVKVVFVKAPNTVITSIPDIESQRLSICDLSCEL